MGVREILQSHLFLRFVIVALFAAQLWFNCKRKLDVFLHIK